MEIINGVRVESELTVDGDLTVTSGDLVVTEGDIDLVHADKKLLLPQKDDAANPTIAFGDGNSGLYEKSNNTIGFVTNGILRFILDSNGHLLSISTNGWQLINEVPTSTNPIYAFIYDGDTGIGRANADALSLIAGGVEGIRITENTAIYTTQFGGQLVHKTDVGAADYNPSVLTGDYIITVDTTAAARAVTISTEDRDTGSTDNPRIFIIKDIAGNAGANNITISLETAGTIDGAATAVINANYNSLTIVIDGANGFII